MRSGRAIRGTIIVLVVLLAVSAAPAGRILRGYPDGVFGAGGQVSTDLGGFDIGQAVAVQRDDRVVVAGYTSNFGGGKIGIVRYTARGRIDRSFGRRGKVLVGFADEAWATDVAIARDGDIVISAVHARYGEVCCQYGAAFVRLDRRGRLDRSFGTGGKLLIEMPAGNALSVFPRAVSVLADGSIVAAGSAWANTNQDELADELAARTPTGMRIPVSRTGAWLARLTPSGEPDPTFGAAGQLLPAFGAAETTGIDLAVQPDGALVLAGGGATTDGRPAMLVARLLANGALDPTFGPGGWTAVRTGDDRATAASAVSVLRNGSILVAGWAQAGSSPFYPDRRVVLARLGPDGALDPTYGNGGVVRFKNGASSSGVGLATTSRGHAYVLGTYSCSGVYCGELPTAYSVTTRGRLVRGFGLRGAAHLPDALQIGSAIALHRGRPLIVGGARAPGMTNQLCSGSVCFFVGVLDFDFMTIRLRP